MECFLTPELRTILHERCYATNNNYAYKYDKFTQDGKTSFIDEMKHSNFVPTYDPWCLNCGYKNARKICAGCKSVYFCNKKCQLECWSIHKKHCKRNLFVLCSNCGKADPQLKCPDCPVRFCSEKCKNLIFAPHKDYDCSYFARTFKDITVNSQ